MEQLDRFIVANPARIPCTVRTLKPFFVDGSLKPWVHSAEMCDAILYLAARVGLPESETIALRELLERLSSSLCALSGTQDPPLAAEANTGELKNHNSVASSS